MYTVGCVQDDDQQTDLDTVGCVQDDNQQTDVDTVGCMQDDVDTVGCVQDDVDTVGCVQDDDQQADPGGDHPGGAGNPGGTGVLEVLLLTPSPLSLSQLCSSFLDCYCFHHLQSFGSVSVVVTYPAKSYLTMSLLSGF